jgi:ATP-dependent protease HslVU (ClpYQ) peptidase subunit
MMRQRASDLVKANSLLKIELEALNSNLSLARDFVQDGLVASSINESEIHVLVDLAELDEKTRSISRKQALLGEFGGSAKKLSLMEAMGDAHERSSDDIMGALTSSLSRLASDANTSQTMLKEAFEKKLSELLEKHDGLMRDQALLNKTSDEAENLHERLSAAVVHLSNVHQNLLARIKATRAFAFRLGSPTSGDAGHEDQESSAVIHERAKPRRSRRHVKVSASSVSSSNHTS